MSLTRVHFSLILHISATEMIYAVMILVYGKMKVYVRSTAVFINNKVKKVIKMASKPLVMRSSIYRIKQSYWCHAGDKQFLRRLIEVEGMHVFTYYYHLHTLDYKQKRHPICILQYVHPSEANISHRPHKNAVRTKKSVLIKVKDEATG